MRTGLQSKHISYLLKKRWCKIFNASLFTIIKVNLFRMVKTFLILCVEELPANTEELPTKADNLLPCFLYEHKMPSINVAEELASLVNNICRQIPLESVLTLAHSNFSVTWILLGSTCCAKRRFFTVYSWPQYTFCKEILVVHNPLKFINKGSKRIRETCFQFKRGLQYLKFHVDIKLNRPFCLDAFATCVNVT